MSFCFIMSILNYPHHGNFNFNYPLSSASQKLRGTTGVGLRVYHTRFNFSEPALLFPAPTKLICLGGSRAKALHVVP